MISTDFADSKLIERLPIVRGSYRQNAELGKNTWFQAGGRAEVLFKPLDADDLATFMAGLEADIPMFVVGVGSNLLVRDGGVEGVVIRLGRQFTQVETCEEGIFALPLTLLCASERELPQTVAPLIPSPVHGGGLGRGHLSSYSTLTANPSEVIIKTGAGLLNAHLTTWCVENGLGGLEFLSGIPGSIGGAIAMNAGAYGSEVKDVLLAAEAVASGELKTFPAAELGFKYRGRDNLRDAVFTAGYFKAYKSPPEEVLARVREIQEKRESTQPVRSRTGGSTFKNPSGHKAWELLDQAGCRGLTCGAAQISNLHCNFLINTGGATAAELEDLGNEAIERVLSHFGIQLEWEIKRIGRR